MQRIITDYLSRQGQSLNAEDEREKAECKKKQRQNTEPSPKEENVGDDSEEDNEDDPVLINWEKEWWRKPGASIVLV